MNCTAPLSPPAWWEERWDRPDPEPAFYWHVTLPDGREDYVPHNRIASEIPSLLEDGGGAFTASLLVETDPI